MQGFTISCYITLYSPPRSVDGRWVRDETMKMTDVIGRCHRQTGLIDDILMSMLEANSAIFRKLGS